MLLWSSTGDEDVDVSVGRWDATKDLVHESLERLCSIRTNSNRPNGVVMAALGMSVGTTGIW